MTKEEAKEWIINHYGIENDGTKQSQVMNYVVKMLEQEPCEDAISRQAVQDYVAKYLSQYLYNDVREAVEVIDEYIGELPPVTPQYTDAEIQKMQDLEQTEIQKAYELGKADVLDKIRAEIETEYGHCDICEYFENYDYEENDISEYRSVGDVSDILAIIDKYRTESEEEE